MLPESQISFLSQKVEELNSAIFYNMSDAVLKLPTTIVSALKVDDIGHVWFFIKRPVQQIQEFDKEFPVRMNFFRKGKSFYLNVTGKACIVIDPEEISGVISLSEEIKEKAADGFVLVKVKVSALDYFEWPQESSQKWFEGVKSQFSRWMHGTRQGYQTYQYS